MIAQTQILGRQGFDWLSGRSEVRITHAQSRRSVRVAAKTAWQAGPRTGPTRQALGLGSFRMGGNMRGSDFMAAA